MDEAVRCGASAVRRFPPLRHLASGSPRYSTCCADKRRLELNEITERIIGCAFTVGNNLGCGFLEKVYENALGYELRSAGFLAEQQYAIEVKYKGVVVGQFFADILVEERVLVELKAVRSLDESHFAQCLNYLKATGLSVCLLINFGNPKVEFKRVVRNF